MSILWENMHIYIDHKRNKHTVKLTTTDFAVYIF